MANVFKSQRLNESDSVSIEGTANQFLLETSNSGNESIRVIYFYVLPKAPWKGVKIGMATCHPGETFWHAIKKRIGEQVNELALNDEDYQNMVTSVKSSIGV